MKQNRALLIVIAVLLLGIFGFYALENSRERTVGEAIDEAVEEVVDEIDDNTTAR